MEKIFWKNPGFKRLKPIKGNITCDYLIVGGGISGVMTAYLLAKEKAGTVVLVEKDTFGSGATGFSAGMILTELEGTDSAELIKEFGKKFTAAYWDAHNTMYTDLKRIVATENISCDLHEGDVYVLADSEKNAKAIRKDEQARSKVDSHAKLVDRTEIRKDINIEKYFFGERVHKGLSVNPLKLLQGIVTAAIKHGVNAFENTAVLSIDTNARLAKTSTGKNIQYKHVVFATDSYSKENPIDRFRTSIGVTRKLTKKEINYLQLEDFDMVIENELVDYCYMKVTGDYRIMAGTGDILVKTTTKNHKPHGAHIKRIAVFLKKMFPKVKLPLEYMWTAMYGLTRNLIPHFETGKSSSRICGAGLQLTSMVMAKYLVHRLTKKTKHGFDEVYK